MKIYLFHLTYDLLKAVVEEKTAGMQIREEQKEFYRKFFTNIVFVGNHAGLDQTGHEGGLQ